MNTKPKKTYKILVASGVNLDLLGKRQPEIYGSQSLSDVHDSLSASVSSLEEFFQSKISLHFFQSNNEYELLTEISKEWDGAVINPGAWTHTSLALADRLAGLSLPFAEVHISNLSQRESVRKNSFTAPVAAGVVYGFGVESYHTGLFGLLSYLKKLDS